MTHPLQQERDDFTRTFMPWAKKAAARIAKSVEAKNKRPVATRKLPALNEASLAYLLVDLIEQFMVATDDYEARYSDKPFDPKTGEGRPPRDMSSVPPQEGLPDYDYSQYEKDYAQDGLPPWEELWDQWYKRERKSPGRNRKVRGGPPTALLYPIAQTLRNWCKRQGHGFVVRYDWPNGPSETAERCETLLFEIAKELDQRYTEENCRAVATNLRDPKRSARQREKRAAKKQLSSRN